MRALVVDDHGLTRKYVRELLIEECGFPDVAEAVDGVDALARLSLDSFDIAIIDIYMPRCDGIRLMAQARARGIDTEFIVWSESPRDVYAPRAAEFGATFLAKTSGPKALMAAVRKAVSHIQTMRHDAPPTLSG